MLKRPMPHSSAQHESIFSFLSSFLSLYRFYRSFRLKSNLLNLGWDYTGKKQTFSFKQNFWPQRESLDKSHSRWMNFPAENYSPGSMFPPKSLLEHVFEFLKNHKIHPNHHKKPTWNRLKKSQKFNLGSVKRGAAPAHPPLPTFFLRQKQR